jgi:AraC-like DNA-binding protein
VSWKATAGFVGWVCEAVEQQLAIPREEVLQAALLDEDDISDPGALIPAEAFADVFRFLRERTGDPGVGLRLAGPLDLRTQGFWGYALLSSLTLRQRFELHLRYQRKPASLSYWEADGMAVVEFQLSGVPADIESLVMDWAVANSLHQLRRHLHPRIPNAQLWLTYREQPYHAALHALAGARVVFDAPCNRLHLPLSYLDVRLNGDPYLEKLACDQLDAQLANDGGESGQQDDLLDTVRGRLAAHLHRDASLVRVARDLRVGARTLQRQLVSFGVSFQKLLEEVRLARAIEFLASTNESVERIALRLGYGDPSTFRRAFRRWTGMAPSAFRAQRRAPQATCQDG